MNSTQFKKGQIPWNKGILGSIKANSGSFQKGQVAHNKGQKHPTGEIHAKNIVGQVFSRWTVLERTPFKNKQNFWVWLCVCECGAQRQLSTQTLRSGGSKSCGCLRSDVMKAKKGIPCHTIESKRKLSEANSGERAWNWKGGITAKKIAQAKLHLGIKRGQAHHSWIEDRTKLKRYTGRNERRSPAYQVWRKQVWLRDNFACKIANPDCAGRIEVHHIFGWTEFVELRYEVNNGITLCHAHHPRKRAEEKRLRSEFQALVSVSK